MEHRQTQYLERECASFNSGSLWAPLFCLVSLEHLDDGANGLPHLSHGELDLGQGTHIGHKGIDGQGSSLHLGHKTRELRAALDAAEGRALPRAAGDELERPRVDLAPGTGDADDGRLTPALVATLQCRAHQLDVADTLEAEVDPTVGHLDDDILNWLVEVEGPVTTVHAPVPVAGLFAASVAGLVTHSDV